MLEISKNHAKNIILNAQLLGVDKRPSTLQVIKHLSYVQIDTISVVERAHHHTLWTRNKNYQTGELNQLLKKKKVFEYWSHAASYLPMQDYRYSLLRKKMYRDGKKHWFSINKKMCKYVLDRIKAEGPLRSADFKSEHKSNGWYSWKPAKQSLEQLFMDGTLMVSERKGFQKVYDLSDRIVPTHIDSSVPSESEWAEHYIKNQLRFLGVANLKELSYLKNVYFKKLIKDQLLKMVENKKVLEVKINPFEEIYYVLKKNIEVNNPDPNSCTILSPFDSFVIQRARLSKFFDFDYQIECYLPEEKRKYGYFCLPVLIGDRLIARVDAKAHRDQKSFEVKSLHFEHGVKLSSGQRKILDNQIIEFARFNNCEKL